MSIACWRGRSTWTCSGQCCARGFPARTLLRHSFPFLRNLRVILSLLLPAFCKQSQCPASSARSHLLTHQSHGWCLFSAVSPLQTTFHSQPLPDQDTFLTKHHCLPVGCKSRSHSCATTVATLPTSPLVTPLSPLDPASSSCFHTCNSLCQELPPALFILRDPP